MPYKDPEVQRAYHKMKSKEWAENNKERMRELQARWREENPKKDAYICQKKDAKRRGIEWLFTLEEWIACWGEKFADRGRGADRLCMARIGDTGPYSPDNVEIITGGQNTKDMLQRVYPKDGQ